MTQNTEVPQSAQKPKIVRSFGQHLTRMPRWHKQALGLALVLAAVGMSAQAYAYFTQKQQPDAQTSSPNAPPHARSFVSGDRTSPQDAEQPPPATWSQRLPKWATRLGISFVAGFVIGWIFRAFIKTMMLLSLLGVGTLVALSYFNILNIDFIAAHTTYETAMQWIVDQADKLRGVATAYLPSSLPGLFGAFLGMRRKKA